MRLGIAAVAAAALLLGSSAAVTAAVTKPPVVTATEQTVADDITTSITSRDAIPLAPPPSIASLTAAGEPTPVAEPSPTPAPAPIDVCAIPAVVAALQSGEDAATIAAMGGAASFRAAVASGAAPCIDLADPARLWVVIDKTRPLDPIDYGPGSLTAPDGLRVVDGRLLRADAAAAMSALGSAAAQSGFGQIGLDSAYRSYDTQVSSYGSQVAERGVAEADLVSARPGFSEHQLGLAADVVACDGGCGTLDDVGASPQGQWLAAHAWEYGWIVRYEDGYTAITGYSPEPWHLRYIGVELAKEYHDGGWHTLEEFFGLPAAPGYIG